MEKEEVIWEGRMEGERERERQKRVQRGGNDLWMNE